LEVQCVTPEPVLVAPGAFAPGHLGELTQVVDSDLVDAVIAETGTAQQRVRLLPTRVVVYFTLALALFESIGYRLVWDKMVAGLGALGLATPTAGALTRARRRVGPAPVRALFAAVCGPVAAQGTAGVFWRGLRLVAMDATVLPVAAALTRGGRFRLWGGHALAGYPSLRLSVLIEAGTRALIAATFGPAASQSEQVQARDLLAGLRMGMLLLADAGYDSWTFIRDVLATGAQLIVRSTAKRHPLVAQVFSDGSYLAYVGPCRIAVRVVEAWVTVRLADGTVRREQWRLLTTLLDHRRYPAVEIVKCYHHRWQVETTFLSIKMTMLDGRVLRSGHEDTLDQEVYALLVTYQALVRIIADAADLHPPVQPQRWSFTIAVETARDRVTGAHGVTGSHPVLASRIATMVLTRPNEIRPPRVKARSRKRPTSPYAINSGKHPQHCQKYTVELEVTYFDKGLTARPHR